MVLLLLGVLIVAPVGWLGFDAGGGGGATPSGSGLHVFGGGPSVNATPNNGTVGSTVLVNGSGFTPSDTVTPYFDGVATTCAEGTVLVAGDGTFDCTETIPAIAAGSYEIGASTPDDGWINTTFLVVPSATISPDSGAAGATTLLTGAGFTEGDVVSPAFGSNSVGCGEGVVTVAPDGSFDCTVTVPDTPSGSYTVSASTPDDGLVNATPLFAVTTWLELDPTSGVVGSATAASGTGFAATSPIGFTLDGATATSTCSTDSTGSFSSCSVDIPAVPNGPQTMVASDGTNTATATFSVGASVAVAPSSGVVGSTPSATGAGFIASAAISFTLDGVSASSPGCAADASGSFDCTVTIPAVPNGDESLVASDGTNAPATPFDVLASISAAPASGIVGSTPSVSGAGFAASTEITFTLDGTAAGASCTSGSDGSFDCAVTVPEVPAGAQSLEASDGTDSATTFFTVDPAISVAPSSGPVGTGLTITGTGFEATAALTVSWDVTQTICSLSSDATGYFQCTATVPDSPVGANSVGAHQGSYTPSTTFTVTSTFSVDPTDGPVDTVITLSGTGLEPSQTYDYCLQSTASECASPYGSFSTPTSGTIPADTTLTVAESYATGDYFVDLSISGTFQLSAPFTVTAVSLLLTPASGPVGTSIGLSGTGYIAGDTYDACYQVGAESCLPNATSFEATGGGDIPAGTTLTAPESVTGAHAVGVYQSGTLLVEEPFTVVASLGLSSTFGHVGLSVVATGAGFDASAPYVLTWDGAAQTCDNLTDGFGNAQCTFVVPLSPAGAHSVALTESANAPSVVFTVTPSLSATPPQAVVGTSVEWAGTGLPASTAFTLAWNGSANLCVGATDSDGAFDCSAPVPSTPGGAYVVSVSAGASFASDSFTVLPSIALSPNSGTVGTSVVATGSGFDASASFTVAWNGTTTLCSGGATLGDGSFSCTFSIPLGPGGGQSIRATEGANQATATFTIEPGLSISDTVGFVGTPETVEGNGFGASASFTLTWDAAPVLCSAVTSALGEFGCTFDVPASVAGQHRITASQGSNSAFLTYTVSSGLTLNLQQGAPGTPLNATGTGFGASAPYTVTWNGGTALCSGVSGPTGSFSCTFDLPAEPGGSGLIVAVEGANEASATFLVTPAIALSLSGGIVGATANASGGGFAAASSVSVQWNASTVLCTATTSSAGSFSCSFSVPSAPAGSHSVTAVQGSSTASASFVIGPSISVAPGSAPIGATIWVNGTGFDAGASFTVLWNGGATVCSGTTDTSGAFSCSFAVPSGTTGSVTITTSQGAFHPSAGFTVSGGPPGPGPSASSTFPWWIVVVVAIVAALLLAALLVYEHRRHHRPRTRSSLPSSPPSRSAPIHAWQETPSAPSATAAPSAAAVPSTASPAASPAVTPVEPGPENDDIDALIQRLERMSQQMFKKSPKELSQEEPSGADSGAGTETK